MNTSLYDALSPLGVLRPHERSQVQNPPDSSSHDMKKSNKSLDMLMTGQGRPRKRRKLDVPSNGSQSAAQAPTGPQAGAAAPRRLSTVILPPILAHPATHATLQLQARLLHLLHARNVNQHRRAIWYRSFGTLRREVGRLCSDLKVRIGVEAEDDESAAKKPPITKRVGEAGWIDPEMVERQERETERRVLARLEWWVEGDLTLHWYTAFTQLVADGQFAPLGLTLLAILARICNITGSTATYERLVGTESTSPATENEGFDDNDSARLQAAGNERMDLGVVVARDDR